MKKPGSLVRRLTQTLILWLSVVWLVCLVGVTWWVSRTINQNFDDELVEISHRMLDIAVADFDRQAMGSKQGVELIATRPLLADDAVIFHLVSASGEILLRAMESPQTGFGVAPVQGFADSGDWRVYTLRHPGRALFLQLADPLGERRIAVNQSLLGLFLPMAAVLPILAFLIAAIARRELKAVHFLESEISLRGGNDLRAIELGGLPDELRQVGEDVNRMLERLSSALDVERALAANAAHELRTPLASVRLRLETALDHGLDRESVEAALAALISVTHRAEKLLQMSRAESGASLNAASVDLVALASAVIEEFWQAGEENRIDLFVDERNLEFARGDMDTLAIALRNLIENALRHGGTGRVAVLVQAPGTLIVRDEGPGVPPGELRALLQRKSPRLSRRPGHGLGLQIVLSIAESHRAQFEIFSPPEGKEKGFEARLVL